MKVIMIKTQEIKNVSFGYGVNYLIPKGLALLATDREIKKMENAKHEAEVKKAQDADKDKAFAKNLTNKEFIIKAKAGKKGKLHGAITRKDIAKLLKVDKKAIVLAQPIKKTGEYKIHLKIGENSIIVRVTVEADKSS